MAPINLKYVISCSSQDQKFPAENLLKPIECKKWLSLNNEKSGKIIAEFQLDKECQISYIDIGTHYVFSVHILVGRSCWPSNAEYMTLLPSSTFTTPNEIKLSKNVSQIRMFKTENFDKNVSIEKWDRLKIICCQPFRKDIQFGLSLLKISAVDEIDNSTIIGSPGVKELNFHETNHFTNLTKYFKDKEENNKYDIMEKFSKTNSQLDKGLQYSRASLFLKAAAVKVGTDKNSVAELKKVGKEAFIKNNNLNTDFFVSETQETCQMDLIRSPNSFKTKISTIKSFTENLKLDKETSIKNNSFKTDNVDIEVQKSFQITNKSPKLLTKSDSFENSKKNDKKDVLLENNIQSPANIYKKIGNVSNKKISPSPKNLNKKIETYKSLKLYNIDKSVYIEKYVDEKKMSGKENNKSSRNLKESKCQNDISGVSEISDVIIIDDDKDFTDQKKWFEHRVNKYLMTFDYSKLDMEKFTFADLRITFELSLNRVLKKQERKYFLSQAKDFVSKFVSGNWVIKNEIPSSESFNLNSPKNDFSSQSNNYRTNKFTINEFPKKENSLNNIKHQIEIDDDDDDSQELVQKNNISNNFLKSNSTIEVYLSSTDSDKSTSIMNSSKKRKNAKRSSSKELASVKKFKNSQTSNSFDIVKEDKKFTVNTLENNTCPLCFDVFESNDLEEHASNCLGPISSDKEHSKNKSTNKNFISHESKVVAKILSLVNSESECPFCLNNFPSHVINEHAEQCEISF